MIFKRKPKVAPAPVVTPLQPNPLIERAKEHLAGIILDGTQRLKVLTERIKELEEGTRQ